MSDMEITYLEQLHFKAMPWLNGGGTTLEICIETGQSKNIDCAFLWRLSMADVKTEGPFSTFEDCDRKIMLIDGKVMILNLQDRGQLILDQHFQPHSFAGDWPVTSQLPDGDIRDFNLIYNRNHIQASLDMVSAEKLSQQLHRDSDIIYLHNFSQSDFDIKIDGRKLRISIGDGVLIKNLTDAVSMTIIEKIIEVETEPMIALVQLKYLFK